MATASQRRPETLARARAAASSREADDESPAPTGKLPATRPSRPRTTWPFARSAQATPATYANEPEPPGASSSATFASVVSPLETK